MSYDPALLRTFLAVAETLSFTRAAERVGLSQPTVSQQVRRLEVAAGRTLIVRDTRGAQLTDHGEAMVGFARGILGAYASAESYFTGAGMRGRLRFGAADDLALSHVPHILRSFRQTHPEVRLELTVNTSPVLYRRLKAGQLDLIYVKRAPGHVHEDVPEAGSVVRTDRLVWMAEERTRVDEGEPVPLVTYAAPSISRDRAIEALEASGRPWRITCQTREVNGVLAAVRAGLGVSPFPHTLIPGDLLKVSNRFSLPDLGEMDFTLIDDPARRTEPVAALAAAIRGRG